MFQQNVFQQDGVAVSVKQLSLKTVAASTYIRQCGSCGKRNFKLTMTGNKEISQRGEKSCHHFL
jgi:hypothetical protein